MFEVQSMKLANLFIGTRLHESFYPFPPKRPFPNRFYHDDDVGYFALTARCQRGFRQVCKGLNENVSRDMLWARI